MMFFSFQLGGSLLVVKLTLLLSDGFSYLLVLMILHNVPEPIVACQCGN
jgi:hypothetical protein